MDRFFAGFFKGFLGGFFEVFFEIFMVSFFTGFFRSFLEGFFNGFFEGFFKAFFAVFLKGLFEGFFEIFFKGFFINDSSLNINFADEPYLNSILNIFRQAIFAHREAALGFPALPRDPLLAPLWFALGGQYRRANGTAP